VIALLEDMRMNGVDQKAPAMVYWPLWQKSSAGSGYVVRRGLEQAIASVNASLAVADVRMLETVYDCSLARASFTMPLLSLAVGMAPVLGW
jgi:hypothetical protein